jgi:uncharacterized protein YbaP (TraB family)
MLYELEGTRLRVLGTLHLLPPGGKLPDWLVSAYEWSEAVFVEHSPTDFLQQARQVTGPLESRVSPAFWQLLQRLTLEAGTREGLFAVEKVRSALLTGRNRCWASAYANPPRRSLVAVGAAHLVGDSSFLDELARVSGCAVRRVA